MAENERKQELELFVVWAKKPSAVWVPQVGPMPRERAERVAIGIGHAFACAVLVLPLGEVPPSTPRRPAP